MVYTTFSVKLAMLLHTAIYCCGKVLNLIHIAQCYISIFSREDNRQFFLLSCQSPWAEFLQAMITGVKLSLAKLLMIEEMIQQLRVSINDTEQ